MVNKRMVKKSARKLGQGMVEFALVLPILLLLIFGIIELGRALFTYIVVVSTAREAARYGSAVGTNSAGIPYYRDCAGIRLAAENIAVLAGLEDEDIIIEYQHQDGTIYGSCPPDSTMGPDITLLGDRIKVTVNGAFQALLPLVSLPDFPINATSARTIIKDVTAGVAILPLVETATVTSTPTPTSTPTHTNTPTQTNTPTATHTHTPTPTEGVTLTPTNTATKTPTLTSTLTPTATSTNTLTPTPACSAISLAFQNPQVHSIKLDIQNGMNVAIRVEEITFTWPNGANQNHTFDTLLMNLNKIWEMIGNTTSPITISSAQWIAGTELIRQVQGNSSSLMQFWFASNKTAADSGYTILVKFDNGCTATANR